MVKPLHTCYNNRSMVITTCRRDMIFKKRSTILRFHTTKEAITTNTVKLQHIGGEEN